MCKDSEGGGESSLGAIRIRLISFSPIPSRTMSLQAAADARKEKLAALKKRKTLHDAGDAAPVQSSADKCVVCTSRPTAPAVDLPCRGLTRAYRTTYSQTRSVQVPQL